MGKTLFRLAGVFVVWIAMGGLAWAEGYGLYEYSARGLSLGGAMVARKPDVSCVAYNPALLARLPGTHMMLGASSVTPRGNMTTYDASGGATTTNLKHSTWFIPHAYFSHQINDRLTFGIGEFTRYGLGFDYPEEWPGRYNIYSVSMLSASLNPNLAVKVNDKFSFALGVEMMYVNLDLQKRVPVNVGVGVLDVDSNIQDANALGVGFNAALHYQFNDQWAAGLLYRSQIRMDAAGDVEFSKREYVGNPAGKPFADAAYAANFHDGRASSTVVLPDSLAFGVSYSPWPDLSLEAGAVWTRWSTFKNLNIHLPENMPTSKSEKDWKDTWRLNVGAEYQLLDWMAVRAGYIYDQSPMTEGHEDYLVPTEGRHIYSTGLGFTWDQWGLDVAYAYIDANGRKYEGRPDSGVYKSQAYGHSNLLSLSISYEF